MKKNFNIVVVIFFCIIAILAGKLVRHTLMKRTLVDEGVGWFMVSSINNDYNKFGLTIKESGSDETSSSAGENAGFIFQKINFLHLATSYYQYETLITIVWNLLLLLILFKLKKSYTIMETLFIVLSVAVLNIFDFTLAKEPVQMLYFILMFLILISSKSNKFKYISCMGIFLLCFATYRNYYILMFGFMGYIYIVYKLLISKIKKVNIKHIMVILLSIFVCYFAFLNVAKIFDVESFNELLRVRLRTSNAASDMRAIFKSTDLFVFTLDYIIMLIRMLIPVELIKLGPKYAIYILYQVIISMILINNLKNINKLEGTRRIALYIYIAFLMGSAAFEPDFGSWIRHEAVLFPVLLIMINKNNEKVEKNEKIYIKNH